MGRYDEAQQWADRLHEVTPDDPGAYSLKAEIYSEQGQMKNAIEAMLKAIDILPNGASLHFDLADLYAETGDTANALVYYASGVDWYMDEEFDEVYLEAEAFIKLHLP
jgi:predicted Zn-dependent protease